MSNIQQEIRQIVSSWSGVGIVPHRFGGIEFQVNGREFGHLHGDYQADIPFTAKLRQALVSEGKASLHHLYPNSGWISFYLRDRADVSRLLELLQLNYDRLAKHRIATVR
jgi:hypothetical protein